MILSKPGKIVAFIVIAWAGAEISYFLWYLINKRKTELRMVKDLSNTVLFFDSSGAECFVDGKQSHESHDIDRCPRVNCVPRNMRYISDYLAKATKAIDVCMYRLTSGTLSSFLETAITKGVKVRILLDACVDEPMSVKQLRHKGAFVRFKEIVKTDKQSQLLMHHKFTVIDGKFLITGSLNWTDTGLCTNWEDAALLAEPCIVMKFQGEFEYLWNTFDTPVEKLPPCPIQRVFPEDLSIWKVNPFHDVFMFRTDTAACRNHMSKYKYDIIMKKNKSHVPVCAYPILKNFSALIQTAEKSIDACVLLLNLDDIADSFLNRFYRGLPVRVIADSHMANLTGSQIKNLISAGVAVRGKHHHANMHHKFIILDRKLVLFGSLNWSMQALCGNSENLVCTNDEQLVKTFSDYFDKLWNEFEPLDVNNIGHRKFAVE